MAAPKKKGIITAPPAQINTPIPEGYTSEGPELNKIVRGQDYTPQERKENALNHIAVPEIEDAPAITIPEDEPTIAKLDTKVAPVKPMDVRDAQMKDLKRAATQAQEAYSNKLQAMYDERKKALEKERTDSIQLASYNALGNALRSMVQPMGWAAGGSTAKVQPYDERQYIDAFNRAVKVGDEIRNLGAEQTKYELDLAGRNLQRAEKEFDFQRRREESQEDFFTRLDAQQQIKRGETYQVLIEKRRENAVKAFYQENARRISHKEPVISFTDFINLDGLGKEYYGNWQPSSSEVKAVEGGMQEVAAKAQEQGASAQGGQSTPTSTTVATPTAGGSDAAAARQQKKDDQALLKALGKYDTNKDGVISRDEKKLAKSNGASVSGKDRSAYEAAWKRLNPNGAKSTAGAAAATASKDPNQQKLNAIIAAAQGNRTVTPPHFAGR